MLNRKESRNDTESKSGKATNAEHEHKVHRNKQPTEIGRGKKRVTPESKCKHFRGLQF